MRRSSDQFLASFISFYFEILSYLACGEKIIRLASKNSVKNQLVISSLSNMLQETLFQLTRYMYKNGLSLGLNVKEWMNKKI